MGQNSYLMGNLWGWMAYWKLKIRFTPIPLVAENLEPMSDTKHVLRGQFQCQNPSLLCKV